MSPTCVCWEICWSPYSFEAASTAGLHEIAGDARFAPQPRTPDCFPSIPDKGHTMWPQPQPEG
eukprot:XP_001692215.1 predicted protein [Chlamydomonas reinhardtii]